MHVRNSENVKRYFNFYAMKIINFKSINIEISLITKNINKVEVNDKLIY